MVVGEGVYTALKTAFLRDMSLGEQRQAFAATDPKRKDCTWTRKLIDAQVQVTKAPPISAPTSQHEKTF